MGYIYTTKDSCSNLFVNLLNLIHLTQIYLSTESLNFRKEASYGLAQLRQWIENYDIWLINMRK